MRMCQLLLNKVNKGRFAKATVEALGKFIDGAVKAIGGFVKDTLKAIGNFAKGIAEAFGKLATTISEALSGAKNLGAAMKEFAGEMAQAALTLGKESLSAIGNFVVKIGKAFGSFLPKGVRQIIKKVTSGGIF